MIAYRCILVLKFLSVMGYAGGAAGAFLCDDPAARKRAVHRVASPSLLATWLSGYALLVLNGWPLFELWVAGALLLSLVGNAALVYCVSRERRDLSAFLGSALPVVCVVALMVVKPTWAQVRP
ncbi:hypothetical protein WME98_22885 [Sorangium sp. So ce296]|uniref:hypothetical protein n=1 Tax=Sorangium sp. So ce296 TaxID=3133296 RepID=UPI003F5F0D21